MIDKTSTNERNKINIFFCNTRYQLNISIRIFEYCNFSNAYFFVSDEAFGKINNPHIPDGVEICVLPKLNKKRGFLESRNWIISTLNALSDFDKKSVRLCLANDDHIFAQLLLSNFSINEVFLFEDGLGSYIQKGNLFNSGFKILLSRLKKILFFFPHYRALNFYGKNVLADKCFSYHKGAFPYQPNVERIVLDRENIENPIIELDNNSLIVVGQPIVELGFVSAFDYLEMISNAISHISHIKKINKIFYKPHPLEKIKKRLPDDFFLLESAINIEDLINSSDETSISFIGFYSTALINIAESNKANDVFFIRSRKIKLKNREKIYNLLSSSGCIPLEY